MPLVKCTRKNGQAFTLMLLPREMGRVKAGRIFVRRDEEAFHKGDKATPGWASARPYKLSGQHPAAWPKKSAAMGVEAHQIPEAMAADKAAGCPIEYDPHDGDAIYRDKDTFTRHCGSLDIYDKDACYSGPQQKARSEDDE